MFAFVSTKHCTATPCTNIPSQEELHLNISSKGRLCARSLYWKKKIIQGVGMQDIIRQRKCSPQMIIMANCMFSLMQSSASRGSSGDFCGQHQFSITPAFCGEQEMSGYKNQPCPFPSPPFHWRLPPELLPKEKKKKKKKKQPLKQKVQS